MNRSNPVPRFRLFVGGVAVLVGALVLLESLVRAVFPLPEVSNFTRLAYSEKTASIARSNPFAMAHATTWWQSEPDAAALVSHLNLYGFRDRTWPVSKRRDTTRVMFIGDSFVEGLGTADGETIPDAFFARSREQGMSLDVLNLGAAGFGLREYLSLTRDAVDLFGPDDLVLVLYMNDLYDVPPDAELLLSGRFVAERMSQWSPRTLDVISRALAGQRVPTRWHQPAGQSPRPMEVRGLLESDLSLSAAIERVVSPPIAAAMRSGRFNPAVTNLLFRSERVLQKTVDVEPVIGILNRHLSSRAIRLWVAYVPSLNQVSDAYLTAQQAISSPIDVPSLMDARYQQQARDIRLACAHLGIPFLDLTPFIRSAEAHHERLYWSYDSHMNRRGYALVGETILNWWSAGLVH